MKMYGFGLKFIEVCSAGPINYISPLVQIMNWHRPGGKPLSEPRIASLLTHICVTWPQWPYMNEQEVPIWRK